MSCCQNPTNLGCYCSCDTVTITTLTGYTPNEVYIEYQFNGANRKQLITEVSATGQPIIDTSTLNEDYNYTFEVIERATGTSLGCFKIKITPCAGDIFDIPALPPVTNFIDSEILFGTARCTLDGFLPFDIIIPDPQLAGLKDGSIINLAFTITGAPTGAYMYSDDLNIEVISPTQIKIISAAAITTISLVFKIPGCGAYTVMCVVTSFDNLVAGWGNGTHTPETKNIF